MTKTYVNLMKASDPSSLGASSSSSSVPGTSRVVDGSSQIHRARGYESLGLALLYSNIPRFLATLCHPHHLFRVNISPSLE